KVGTNRASEPVRTPATSTSQSFMPPTQLSQPDPKCSSMRTTTGVAGEGTSCGAAGSNDSCPAPPGTGAPAIAAATVPSKVTFGQPTGSCGINALNATCCTDRAVDGVTLMVKRCAPLRAANPAAGGSTAIARERGSEG